MFSNVDFPQPLGPTMQTNDEPGDAKRDSFANREVQLICMAQIQRHATQIYHGEIEGKIVLSKKTGIRFA
jgi:hypothetical protein